MAKKLKPRFRYEDVEKWVGKHGWFFVRQKGSHRHYQHTDKTRGTITIPYRVSLNVLKIIEKKVGAKYGD